MSKVNRFSLEERYGYQNRKVIYDKDADNDIELNSIYPIIDLLNQLYEQISDLQHKHQDKISFAVEQLEKVKENIHYLLSFDYNLVCRVNEQIDSQIKELKGEE